MKLQRVLVTGDFGHPDFNSIVSSTAVVTTLVPMSDVVKMEAGTFDVIVVAQSRRGQISQGDIEMIRRQFALVPIVNLLGSWCEGHERSGWALQGVKPVFWYQWSGRFAEFITQLQSRGKTDWHLPATATHGDRMNDAHGKRSLEELGGSECHIGVYALTMAQFEMFRDTFDSMGWQSFWMLQQDSDEMPFDPPDVICMDGLSLTPILEEKVHELKELFPNVPLVVMLNFPRRNEIERLCQIGVTEVVGKPFEHVDLQLAVNNAVL